MAWGGALLAPESLFWDDWVIAGDDTERIYRELGLPWMGPIVVGLFSIGPVAFKVVALLATALTGIGLYQISSRVSWMSRWERVLVAVVVAVVPFNVTHVSVAVLITYTLSLAVFVVAWWVLVAGRSLLPRTIVAAGLFFVSFTTASLLPLMVLPVLHLLALRVPRGPGVVGRITWFVLGHWPIFVAPVGFWVMRSVLLTPTGLYGGYNGFRLPALALPLSVPAIGLLVTALVLAGALAVLALGVWRGAWGNRVGIRIAAAVILVGVAAALLATRSAGNGLGPLLAAVVALTALAILLPDRLPHPQGPPRATIAAAGSALMAWGALPYLLVGKVPTFTDWETRHQFLLPIGFAILILVVVRSVRAAVSDRAAVGLGVAMVVVLVAASANVSVRMVEDWRKQQQIIAVIAQDDDIRAASTVVFESGPSLMNFDGGSYRFYELTGWLGTAFGDASRLGIDAASVPSLIDGGLDRVIENRDRFGFGDHDPDGVIVLVAIDSDGEGPRLTVTELEFLTGVSSVG